MKTKRTTSRLISAILTLALVLGMFAGAPLKTAAADDGGYGSRGYENGGYKNEGYENEGYENEGFEYLETAITSDAEFTITEGVEDEFQVETDGAIDVVFELEDEPEGVLIDAEDGLMTFDAFIPAGEYEYTIFASDAEGATVVASQDFTLTVTEDPEGGLVEEEPVYEEPLDEEPLDEEPYEEEPLDEEGLEEDAPGEDFIVGAMQYEVSAMSLEVSAMAVNGEINVGSLTSSDQDGGKGATAWEYNAFDKILTLKGAGPYTLTGTNGAFAVKSTGNNAKITLNSINITAPGDFMSALAVYGKNAVVTLVGANTLRSPDTGDGFCVGMDRACTVTSSNGGTMTAYCSSAGAGAGITLEGNSTLKVTGNAKISTRTSYNGIYSFDGCSINVGKGAELEAVGSNYGIEVYRKNISIVADGKVGVTGTDMGISSYGPLSVYGAGLAVSGKTPISVQAPTNTIYMADNARMTVNNTHLTDNIVCNLKQIGNAKTHKWNFTGSSGLTVVSDANYTGTDISVNVVRRSSPTFERIPAGGAPAIFAPANKYLAPGYAATSTGAFKIKGSPAPKVFIAAINGDSTAFSDKIKWNAGSKKLSIAKGLGVGEYRVWLIANNGVGTAASYYYYITVAPPVNGFKATAHNAVTTKLDWKHNASATGGYEVWMAYGAGEEFYKMYTLTGPETSAEHEFAITGSAATFHHKGKSPGEKHYYKVRAVGKNTSGEAVYGPFTAVKSVKTALKKVTGVKAVSSGFSTNIITWNEVPFAEEYYIHRADKSNGKYVSIGTVSSWPRVFEDNNLVAGKTHHYKIMASAGYGDPAPFSAAAKAPPKTNKMKPLKITSERYDQVRISTTTLAGADGYEFYRAESSKGSFTKVLDVNAIRSVGAFSVVDKGVTTGKTYYYKSRAFKYSATGIVYGGYSNVAAGASAPDKVPGPNAASADSDAVKVTWNKTNGASGYEIYKATTANGKYTKAGTVTSGSILEYTVRGLKANTGGFFKVRAYAEVDKKKTFGVYSSVASAITTYGGMGNTYAESASPTSIKFGWEKVDWATEYKIVRREGSVGSFQDLKTVKASVTSIVDTGLTTGETYHYRVCASNGKGYETPMSATVNATPAAAGGATLAQVSGVTTQVETATSVTVSWNAVADAGGYEVYRSTSSNGSYTMVRNITGSTRTYTDTGLESGATYWYKVRAWRTAGSGTQYGAYSLPVSAAPSPNTPLQVDGIKAVSATFHSINISWTAVSGATGYEVHRGASANGTFTKAGTATGASFTEYNLNTGTTYYYKVRAYSTVGGATTYGSFSSTASAAPTLGQVESLKGMSAGLSSTRIEWKSVTGADGYEIHRCVGTNSSGTYTLAKTIASGNTAEYIDPALLTNTMYWYKVRAYVNVNGNKVYGAFSAAASATTSSTVYPYAVAVRYQSGTASGSYGITGAGNFSMPMTSSNSTCTLAAEILPSNANTSTGVTWSSNNTTVATVSSSGVVTARAIGYATITATTGPSGSVSNILYITVVPAVTGLSFSATSFDYKEGTEVAVQNPLSFTPENAYNKVTYSSDKKNIVDIGESSVRLASTVTYTTIKAKAAGKATVTVTGHNGRTATFTANVKPALKSAVFIATTRTLALQDRWDPPFMLDPTDGFPDYEMVSSNTKVAYVENNKTVVASSSGVATISLKLNGKIVSNSVVTVTGTGESTPPSGPVTPPGGGGGTLPTGGIDIAYESSDCEDFGKAALTISLTKLVSNATYYVVTEHNSKADAEAGTNPKAGRAWQVLASNAAKPISMSGWDTGKRYICITAFSSPAGNYSASNPLGGTKLAHKGWAVPVLYHPMYVGDITSNSDDSFLLCTLGYFPGFMFLACMGPYAAKVGWDPIPGAEGYEIHVWSQLPGSTGELTDRGVTTISQDSGRVHWASGTTGWSNYNGLTAISIQPFVTDSGERVYGNYRALELWVVDYWKDWSTVNGKARIYDKDPSAQVLYFDFY